MLSEILLRLGVDENIAFGGIAYTVLDGRGAYFQNVSGISLFSPCEIELYSSSNKIRVCGSNLSITKYSGGDLAISGKVCKVERCV